MAGETEKNKIKKFFEFSKDIPEQEIAAAFLGKLTKKQVFFISKITCEYLSRYGINTLSDVENLSKKDALAMIQLASPPGVVIRSESNPETQQALLGLMTALTASITGNLANNSNNNTNISAPTAESNSKDDTQLTAEEQAMIFALGDYGD